MFCWPTLVTMRAFRFSRILTKSTQHSLACFVDHLQKYLPGFGTCWKLLSMKQDQTALLLMPQLTCSACILSPDFLLFFWVLRSKGTARIIHLINLNIFLLDTPILLCRSVSEETARLTLSISSSSFTLGLSRRGRSLALIDSCCKPVTITWINNDCTKEALYFTVLSTACEENVT